MSYIKNTLLDHERVLYETHPHWIIYLPAIGWLLLGIVIDIIGPRYHISSFKVQGIPALYALLGYVAYLMALYAALKASVMHFTAEYAITNKRVLLKKGLVRRDSIEIMISKVESIKVQQTITGRIMNYGTVLISGTGGSVDPFRNVPDPLHFRNRVQQQLDTEMNEQRHDDHHEQSEETVTT